MSKREKMAKGDGEILWTHRFNFYGLNALHSIRKILLEDISMNCLGAYIAKH